MAGYFGYSMSNNARAAYNNGEMPLSKWTKKAIVEAIAEIDEEKTEMVKKLTVSELKKVFLKYTAWHHTSCKYNETAFYAISEDSVNSFTILDCERIIKNRKPHTRRSKEVIEAEKAEKAKRQAEKAAKDEKESLFKYQTRFKTLSRFMRCETIDIEELRAVRKAAIEKKRVELKEKWVSQNCDKIKYINDDDFVERRLKL